MPKKESDILKKAVEDKDGQISPAIMINVYAGGDQAAVERLVSQGLIERVYKFEEGERSTYSIIFYTVTEKGYMCFAPFKERLWFNFRSQTTLWVGLVSIIVSIAALGTTVYFSYLQNLRENQDFIMRSRPYLVVSDVKPLNVVVGTSADFKASIKNVGVLPALIVDSSISCGSSVPISANGKTAIGNGEQMFFNFSISSNLGAGATCELVFRYFTAGQSMGEIFITTYDLKFNVDGIPIFENAVIK